MLDFPAPKTMAKALRAALAERGHALSHAQCLDLVARQLGCHDWNVLASKRQPEPRSDHLIMPKGWFAAQHSTPAHYRMGIDPAVPGVARIEAREGVAIPPDLSGVMMQSFAASAYRGQRLSFTAEIRTQGSAVGTIWMRVDPRSGRYLSFDNMLDRREDGPLTGNHGWARRSVVLDVADSAESIHFGLLLKGSGAVLARNVSIGVVSDTVAVTGQRGFPDDPVNLGLAS